MLELLTRHREGVWQVARALYHDRTLTGAQIATIIRLADRLPHVA